MNKSTIDYIFKALAAGLVPAAIWINSLSVEVALLQEQVKTHVTRLDKVEQEQRKILDGVNETQLAIKEIVVTINFMKDLLEEIRDAK